jgi:hypothetical protein
MRLKDSDPSDASIVSCLDKTEQEGGLYALGDKRTEDYVLEMIAKNNCHIKSGSSLTLLKQLFSEELVIAQYKWDNEQLTDAVHNMIQNKRFAKRHNSKADKITWWGTGGPAHSN